MVAASKIANLFALPSPTLCLGLGFCLALASAFLFKVSVKQPVSSRYAAVVAAANILAAIALAVSVAFGYLAHEIGSKVLIAVAVLHACVGLTQIVLISRSSHTYQQTDAIAV